MRRNVKESLETIATTMVQIKKDIKRIENLHNDHSLWSGLAEDIHRYKLPESQHAEFLKTQETMWRQRSRALWLKDGNKNTKFFHGKASQRNKVNQIKKIKDGSGVWWRGDDNVETVLLYYFNDLFSSSNPTDVENVFDAVRGKLTKEFQVWCNRPFIAAKVRDAVDQMHPLKAPGPVGLPALFFQKY